MPARPRNEKRKREELNEAAAGVEKINKFFRSSNNTEEIR